MEEQAVEVPTVEVVMEEEVSAGEEKVPAMVIVKEVPATVGQVLAEKVADEVSSTDTNTTTWASA